MNSTLLDRYIKGEASPSEEAKVVSWANKRPENKEMIISLHRIHDTLLLSGDADISVSKRSAPKKRRGTALRVAYYMAAAAAGAFAVTLFPGLHDSPIPSSRETFSVVSAISAAAGEHVSQTLYDGTAVTLNSGSTLEILSKSGDSQRRVRLNGEAFFNVAKDEEHPFVVETEDIDISVLGTEFDVRSDRAEPAVVLVSGKVKITESASGDVTTLSPGQRFSFNPSKGTKAVTNVNPTVFVSWKDGYLLLDSSSLDGIFRSLQEYYSVPVVYEGDPGGARDVLISGKLELHDGLGKALSNLNMLIPISWTEHEDGSIGVNVSDK